jgi:hypothetical protein
MHNGIVIALFLVEYLPHLLGGKTMTIGNAMAFIKRGINDSELRDRLNTAPSIRGRDEILSDERLQFAHHEFEDAYHNLLTLCKEVEAADQLKEFKSWWAFLTYSLEPDPCSSPCNGCCSEQSTCQG